MVGTTRYGQGSWRWRVKFSGQVLQTVKKLHIIFHLVIYFKKINLGVDGNLKADGQTIYEAKDMKVGLFSPNNSVNEKSCNNRHGNCFLHWK